MSHITGTVQPETPALTIGPDSGTPATAPNTWAVSFAHTAAPGGTKLLILHFQNVSLPAANRLEVDLGYDTDVFTSADGSSFWTRPINVYALAGGLVPIRYVTSGALNGSVQLDRYGRGERHVGETGHPSNSNCDPFQGAATYVEPTYDPFWYCANPPNWENVARAAAPDVRALVARSVGIIVSVEHSTFTGIEEVSTCSVTLVDSDKVITAGHCHTPAEALGSSVTFDYQTDAAGNRPAGYNARFYKVVEVIKHHWPGADYSLLRLASPPPGIPEIQMRHDLPAFGEQVFGIHHPNGAVKKLSTPHPGFATVTGTGASAINVPSTFHVSGGSSGSGLFDRAGRICGVLSNGNPCSGSPLTYFPTATILQDIAPAPPPPVTRDVMVVFDRSGSMTEPDGTGRTKIEAARDAVSLFIQLVRSGVGNRAGLVSFSTGASSPVDATIANVDAAEKLTLIGPAPYAGGRVGVLAPGGSTSIGEGLEAARLQFPGPGANPRAMLVLTDGMENTPRWISDVEGALAGIDIHAIGFGTDANIDSARLMSLVNAHNGLFTRAESGIALEKFFSHAFGNIFESGILMDPETVLPADADGAAQSFDVCGEEALTVVLGWDRTDAVLFPEVGTPAGATISIASAGTDDATGRTWSFLRIPLPYGGERDGTWSVRALRPGGGGEFPAPKPQLRYFINVIPSGGATLTRAPDRRRYYTGDSINPLVFLLYGDGGWPRGATVTVSVTHPGGSVGDILTREGLRPPATVDGDTVPARQATLTALTEANGAPLVAYSEDTFDLSGESADTEGAFEESGLYGLRLPGLLRYEGTYSFHYRASYGDAQCTATRELVWAIHVDAGVDAGHTDVKTTATGTTPDGKRTGTVVVTPRDPFGSHLGPGRGADISLTGTPGTVVTGPVQDNGDGSYTVPVAWEPGASGPRGVVLGQPGRPPVVIVDPKAKDGHWRFLFWLLLLIAILLLILLLVVWLS
jgi:hypothetical protein